VGPSAAHKISETPHNQKAQVHPKLHAYEVSPPEMSCSESTQPYGSSYFTPGKLNGKAATFLLDTWCTTNLLSRGLYDTLSARDRANLEPYSCRLGPKKKKEVSHQVQDLLS